MPLHVTLDAPTAYPDALDAYQQAVGVTASLLGELTEHDAQVLTGAAPWTVRDVMAHLADTEHIAHDTLTDGPRAFERVAREHRQAEALTAAGVQRLAGTDLAGLADSWVRSADLVASTLRRTPDDARVRWGFGVSAATFLRARAMELWAHLVDITDALDAALPRGQRSPVEQPAMQRLVAELGVLTLPYALARQRIRMPDLDLYAAITGHRIEIRIGAEVLHGPLVQWCRACTRRPAIGRLPGLETEGPLAAAVAANARCYL